MTRHLVQAISTAMPVAQAKSELVAAHEYLVRAARAVAVQLAEFDPASWGTRAKRLPVSFAGARPSLVSPDLDDENFVELLNQCATIERLIDALAWAETELAGWTVMACHPTTSSGDNDLVLRGPKGERACFEVSDIVGAAVLAKARKDVDTLKRAAADRSFLVVSREMALVLLRRQRPLRDHVFEARNGDGVTTRILEVLAAPVR